MDRRDAMFKSRDVQEPLAEIDLIPAQADQFGHAQAMAVGDQDQCGVPCAVSADTCSRLAQCRDLLFRQIFAASVSRVRLANGYFPIFDGWRGAIRGPGTRMVAHGEIQSFHIWPIIRKVCSTGITKPMANKSERLTVLSDAEQFALYGLPDFDDRQRLTYLSLSGPELALASSRPGLHAQVWCTLQIGYFKAKHAFFRFTWDDAREDCTFVLARYFKDQLFHGQTIAKHEHYVQRTMITELFGYRPWSADFLTQLAQQAAQIVRRDVTPGFIVAEFIAWLNERKIIRPGYTTLQTLISEALSAERGRLGGLLADMLDDEARKALAQLLARDDTLSELAALRQDAKNFRWRQMANEREKRARLEPLYLIARTLLPSLAVSQRNLHHYASLANFYTVYDLRRLKTEQTHLYLLCYAWQRYRQLTDNLVDALSYHMKQIEDESKARANKQFVAEQAQREQETPRVGRLLLL